MHVIKTHVTLYVKKLIFFGLENIISKLYSQISVLTGEFYMTFEKLAVRASLGLKHSPPSVLNPDKALLLSF